MTTTYHSVSPPTFAAIATGRGGGDAIEELHAAQVSKHLMLIMHLLEAWPDTAAAQAATDLLERSRAAAPEAFQEILGAPLVGAWSGIAVRALERDSAQRADFLHVNTLALRAAAAAGIDASLPVPVNSGVVVLPGWGAASAGDRASAGDPASAGAPASSDRAEVLASVSAGRVRVGDVEVPVPPTAAAPGWQPLRHLTGDGIDLELDDLHPYRHGHHVPPAARLSDEAVVAWQAGFAAAWELLADRLPERAAELRAGLRTLVPLQQTDRAARSATIRHAFGVFGLTLPPAPDEFAVTLVHEFQHSKLSALLDLVPLTDPEDTGRYFAPWRTDPRPLPGLLQGVYAFAGVADSWRALRGPDRAGAYAERQFAEARIQVDCGLIAVERSGALTADGEALVSHLRRSVDEMLAEDVPQRTVDDAERALADTLSAWRERNGL
ncbi:HEXXH motif domain-containing protein [Actinoplanes sp. NPDC089786]|uniref:HEXXH motif domain-containing protein n=1 Tax=Actinoplanes sp. NPDC089786 TaxID=3155185 RepID=UPI0034251F12